MITPLEIENKQFAKAMRGYNADEVDQFLDEITLDLQKLLAENERLKAKVESLESDLNQYKKIRDLCAEYSGVSQKTDEGYFRKCGEASRNYH